MLAAMAAAGSNAPCTELEDSDRLGPLAGYHWQDERAAGGRRLPRGNRSRSDTIPAATGQKV
jgi:hypothetical protein